MMTSKPVSSADMERERTFQNDDKLPPLPVPKLEDTIKNYLDSAKPFATEEEFKETERITREFCDGVGLKLQDKLLERAKTRKNWLEQWWHEKAYLSSRTPLAMGSMIGANRTLDSFWPPCPGSMVERAAIVTWFILRFFQQLRKETYPVEKSKSGEIVFSMNQHRYLLNGGRVPGTEMDEIRNYFKTEREGACPDHVIVSCNSHLFRVDPFDNDGQLVNAKEYARQIQQCKDRSDTQGQCIATLTCDERTQYAKNYSHLKNLDPRNAEHLDTINKGILLVSLDEANPSSVNELINEAVSGRNKHNHWFDKSYIMVVNANGTIACICDHCGYDGMAPVDMTNYGYVEMEKIGGAWPDPNCEVRDDIPEPQELVFTTDAFIEDAIVEAGRTHDRHVNDLDILISHFGTYGKAWCKKFRLHPDFICQLGLQLAYYRMYGRPAPTYETATTRQYYNGRTETCRSGTPEALAWCKAMVNPNTPKSQQVELLMAAYKKHATLMMECTQGRGCDRHLMGLYLISEELGLPPPNIFLDPSFAKSGGGGNYILSTSLSGYKPFIGLVAPMCKDGYFCTYRITDERIELCVESYRTCSETDNYALFRYWTQSLIQIQDLTLYAASKL